MLSIHRSEPGQPLATLHVGQDVATGHFFVQNNEAHLEGCFISFATAMAFAQGERHSLDGATIVIEAAPLIARVPFARVAPSEPAAHLQAAALMRRISRRRSCASRGNGNPAGVFKS